MRPWAQIEGEVISHIFFRILRSGIPAHAFTLLAWRNFLQKQNVNTEISRQKELIEETKEILDSIRYAKRIEVNLLPRESYMERVIRYPKRQIPNLAHQFLRH